MPEVVARISLDDTKFFFKGILMGYVFNFHLSRSFSEFVRPLVLNEGELKVVVKVRPPKNDSSTLFLSMASQREIDSDEKRRIIDEIRWELGLTEDPMTFHQKFGHYFPELPLGYRVTKTPIEEILLTALLSQNASMNMYALQAVRLAWFLGGKLIDDHGRKYVFLPTWDEVAKASKNILLDCKLGYRIKYLPSLLELVESIRENDLLKEWRTLSTGELIKTLTKTKGIGQYTAATIALYSLGRKDAFFSDAYIQKLLEPILVRENVTLSKLTSMAAWRQQLNELWDGHGGWMVDFLTASDMIGLNINENPHFLIHRYYENLSGM